MQAYEGPHRPTRPQQLVGNWDRPKRCDTSFGPGMFLFYLLFFHYYWCAGPGLAQKLRLWPGLRRLGLCKSLGPAKAPSEGLAWVWLGSGCGFWQRNIFIFKILFFKYTEQIIKISHTWGSRRITSRTPAATSVMEWWHGWYVMCLLSLSRSWWWL